MSQYGEPPERERKRRRDLSQLCLAISSEKSGAKTVGGVGKGTGDPFWLLRRYSVSLSRSGEGEEREGDRVLLEYSFRMTLSLLLRSGHSLTVSGKMNEVDESGEQDRRE